MLGARVLSGRLPAGDGQKHSEAYMSEYQQLVQEEIRVRREEQEKKM